MADSEHVTMTLPAPDDHRPAATCEAHERMIRALIGVGQVVLTSVDYEQVLERIIESVCTHVGADSGGFMVYDEESGELALQKPAFGVYVDAVVDRYRVPLSAKSNAVRVYLSRQTYVSNDAQNDPRLIRRLVDLFETRNVITVPLIVADTTIGVFHVINKPGGFCDLDRQILELLAPMLAASLQSARMFRWVQDERNKLERAMLVHRELSHTVVATLGFAPLCSTLNRLIQRPVLVIDAAGHPIASCGCSSALAAARTMTVPEGVDAVRRVTVALGERSAEVTVAPIHIGPEREGFVVVEDGGRKLDAIDTKAVEQAATIFALRMVQENSIYETERRLKGDLLHQLFREDAPEEAANAALRRLGYPTDGPWRAVRLDATAHRKVARLGPTLQNAVASTLANIGICSPLVPWRSGFVTLLSEEEVSSLCNTAFDLESLLHRPCDVRCGIGREAGTVRDIARSLESAEQALVAAKRLGISGRAVAFEELGVYRLLLGGNHGREHAEFVDQVLGPLVAADNENRRGSLLLTLEALSEEGFRCKATAERLGVHINTLKYRMKKLQDLLGGDPSQGELRLEVQLALKVLRLQRLRSG